MTGSLFDVREDHNSREVMHPGDIMTQGDFIQGNLIPQRIYPLSITEVKCET